jgi:cytosine/adenosine deaminase-related metal-dependent hydrolase
MTSDVLTRRGGAARDLGPGRYHTRYRTIETLGELGLLDADINYAHANQFTDDEYRQIGGTGGTISSCPSVELMLGIGGRALSVRLVHS